MWPAAGPSAENKTLVVRNLSYDTSEDDIKEAFEDAIKKVKVKAVYSS